MKPKDDKGTVYLKAKPSELRSVLENILGTNLKGGGAPNLGGSVLDLEE